MSEKKTRDPRFYCSRCGTRHTNPLAWLARGLLGIPLRLVRLPGAKFGRPFASWCADCVKLSTGQRGEYVEPPGGGE